MLVNFFCFKLYSLRVNWQLVNSICLVLQTFQVDEIIFWISFYCITTSYAKGHVGIVSRLLEGIKYHKDNVFIIYWLHTPNQLAIAIISEC